MMPGLQSVDVACGRRWRSRQRRRDLIVSPLRKARLLERDRTVEKNCRDEQLRRQQVEDPCDDQQAVAEQRHDFRLRAVRLGRLPGAPCDSAKPGAWIVTAKAEELLRELGGRRATSRLCRERSGFGQDASPSRRCAPSCRRRQARGDRLDRNQRPARLRAHGRRSAANSAAARDDRRTDFRRLRFEAAVREKPEVVLLDELAHDNLGRCVASLSAGKTHWPCAAAGIGVIGAFNIQHLETVAPTAER